MWGAFPRIDGLSMFLGVSLKALALTHPLRRRSTPLYATRVSPIVPPEVELISKEQLAGKGQGRKAAWDADIDRSTQRTQIVSMADLEGRMSELLRERKDAQEEKRGWEAFITNKRECLRIFSFTRHYQERLRAEQQNYTRELLETERRLVECEAAIEGLETVAQRAEMKRVEVWERHIQEMQSRIAEQREQIERFRVEETGRRARWEVMRRGG
ncbi:hypothetical protein LTR95_008807 [Oleoguttula sp. CCFEE 5521]